MSELFHKFSSPENLQLAYRHMKAALEKSSLGLLPVNNGGITAVNELGDMFFDKLSEMLRNNRYQPEATFTSWQPKNSLDVRPAYALSTIDRIVYQAIMNPDILGNKQDILLEDFCYGNRLGQKTFLKPYVQQWNKYYEDQLAAYKGGYVWRVSFDISRFFENISHQILIDNLNDLATDNSITNILSTQLITWSSSGNGIPQGPDASWVLANFYLKDFDKFSLLECLENDLRFFRYADDMVVMAKSRSAILKYSEKAALWLRSIGLNINEKTSLSKVSSESELRNMQFDPSGEEGNPEAPLLEQNEAHALVKKIISGSAVSRSKTSELSGFLARYLDQMSTEFYTDLVQSLEYKPSLVAPVSRYLSRNLPLMDFFIDTNKDLVFEKIWDEYKNSSLSGVRIWMLRVLVEAPGYNTVQENKLQDLAEELLRSSNSIEEVLLACWHHTRSQLEISYESLMSLAYRFENTFKKSLLLFFAVQLPHSDQKRFGENLRKATLGSNEGQLIWLYLDHSDNNSLVAPRSFGLLHGQEPAPDSSFEEIQVTHKGVMTIYHPTPSSHIRKKRISLKPLFGVEDWTKLTIKVNDGAKSVDIEYPGQESLRNVHFDQLGFLDGRSKDLRAIQA